MIFDISKKYKIIVYWIHECIERENTLLLAYLVAYTDKNLCSLSYRKHFPIPCTFISLVQRFTRSTILLKVQSGTEAIQQEEDYSRDNSMPSILRN